MRRAESRLTAWLAPFWILALVGILFMPTEFRAGAETPHSHALLQLLLDAHDGRIAHIHAFAGSSGFVEDWLDPEVHDVAAGQEQAGPDLGQQQERVSTLSLVSFLVLLPIAPILTGNLPRITPASRRLTGQSQRVLSPPPRLDTATD